MKVRDFDISKAIDDMKRVSRRDALRVFGGAGFGMFLTTLADPVSISGQTKKIRTFNYTAQKDNLQGAGFYRFKVGAFDCTALSDGMITIPSNVFFAAPQAEVEHVLRDNFLPVDKIFLHINTLVVKTGRKVVLIDTGVGNYLGAAAGILPINLHRSGISLDEITDVVFSHAHFDHIGGTINRANKFNFPNARYHISQIEWEMAMNPKEFVGEAKMDAATLKVISEAIKHNLSPLKNRISLFNSDLEIVPGITAMTAYGHTPGHAVYLVKSGDQRLLFTGDLIHHAAVQFARPEWSMFGDSRPQEAFARRKQILDRVVDERLLIMGSHLPFPGIGHVRARDGRASYEWIPVEWKWQV